MTMHWTQSLAQFTGEYIEEAMQDGSQSSPQALAYEAEQRWRKLRMQSEPRQTTKLTYPDRPRYRHYARITVPSGRLFPVDMLRYDSCFPWQERDSGDMESCLFEVTRGTGSFTMIVARYSDSAGWDFTVERWKSFNCECEPTVGNFER